MGSIYYINSKPSTWEASLSKFKVKPELGGSPLYEVTYGDFDDYPNLFPLSIFMRESIYNACLDGTIEVDPESYFAQKLILRNAKTKINISPLKDGIVY